MDSNFNFNNYVGEFKCNMLTERFVYSFCCQKDRLGSYLVSSRIGLFEIPKEGEASSSSATSAPVRGPGRRVPDADRPLPSTGRPPFSEKAAVEVPLYRVGCDME